MLDDLERFRVRLGGLFDHVPGDIAVVIHPHPLMLPRPHTLAAGAAAGVRTRRPTLLRGLLRRREIHVLAPSRAGAPGLGRARDRARRWSSRRGTSTRTWWWARHNPALPPPFTPGRFARYARMAWLSEGAATHLAGQVPHLRAAVARRLREGGRPVVPARRRATG